MNYYQKQKQLQQKNNSAIVYFICAFLVFAAFMYAQGVTRELQMYKYAIQNNCNWHYNGSYYLDNRDYTCR